MRTRLPPWIRLQRAMMPNAEALGKDTAQTGTLNSSMHPVPTPPLDPKPGSKTNPLGYEVPYQFRLVDSDSSQETLNSIGHLNQTASGENFNYSDYSGFRFPTLQTAETYRYWKDKGFDRIQPRVFPIFLEPYRKLDPLLRYYLYFLHSLDPARFSVRRLQERYRLSEDTLRKAYHQVRKMEFRRANGLTSESMRQISREEAVENIKERVYALRMGYKQIGDEEVVQEDNDEFKGYKSTADYIRLQNTRVETLSAFPLPELRKTRTKRTDYDIIVKHTSKCRVMDWKDPKDPISF